MARPLRSARTGAEAAQADAALADTIRVIAGRLAGQREQLARRVVDTSCREIVDYRTPPDPHLLDEEFVAALEHLDALVASLRSGEPVAEDHFARVRELGARRLHQGVPLESFGRAARLWSTVCWQAVLSVARIDSPPEREAALEIASRVFELGDRISIVATQAYLDEVTDRGLLRRDLLDALLTAKGDGSCVMGLARRLHLRLEENYVVVVVRGEGVDVEEAREQSPASRSRLDRIVEETRRAVRPSAGSLLAGMRNGDLVVLYPASDAGDMDAVKHDCRELADALGADVSIGMSGWHEGRGSVGTAYAEAKDAVAIAARIGITGRALGLDELLVEHMLACSAPARGILAEVLRPLADYDAARQAALVPTLRAYLLARFNVTKAAAALFVNPNTIVYRLRRIKDLTGRDTHDLDDLLVLYLALKLKDLGL
jgi:sugar diacid utilization regulator